MPSPEEKRLVTQAQHHRLAQLRLLSGPHGEVFIRALAAVTTRQVRNEPLLDQTLGRIQRSVVQSLASAPCLGVPADISAIVDQSHATYPKHRVDPKDMLSPDGWAYFATPINDTFTDEPIRALSWATTPTTAYHPHAAPESHTLLLMLYSTSAPRVEGPGAREFPELAPLSSVVWDLGDDEGGLHWLRLPQVPGARAHYVRMAATLWRVIHQRLVLTEETAPVLGGQVQRAHKAARRHLDGGRVNDQALIARLAPRRRRKPARTGTGTPHSYRYGVRSHWRFPAGAEDPVLIRAQERGPEDQEIRPDTLGRLFLPPKPPKKRSTLTSA